MKKILLSILTISASLLLQANPGREGLAGCDDIGAFFQAMSAVNASNITPSEGAVLNNVSPEGSVIFRGLMVENPAFNAKLSRPSGN